MCEGVGRADAAEVRDEASLLDDDVEDDGALFAGEALEHAGCGCDAAEGGEHGGGMIGRGIDGFGEPRCAAGGCFVDGAGQGSCGV